MKIHQTMMAGMAMLMLSFGAAQAGPCTTGKDGKMSDAGTGPTPGNTGQTITTGSANTTQHPPTSAMGNAAGGSAASSEDVQRQTKGQPTAAQQAQGAKGEDC
ncbi:MAG TPA: hypothetical protein VIQ05_15620 [Tardiphaga sp.]